MTSKIQTIVDTLDKELSKLKSDNPYLDNFKDTTKTFETIFNNWETFSNYLHSSIKSNAEDKIHHVWELVNALIRKDRLRGPAGGIESPDNTKELSDIDMNLKGLNEKYHAISNIIPIIDVSKFVQSDNSYRDTLDTISRIENKFRDFEDFKNELKNFRKAKKDALASMEIIGQTKFFELEAKEFEGKANGFKCKLYWSTGITGLLVLSFLILVAFEIIHPTFWTWLYSSAVTGIGLYLISFFSRQYNAAMHNYTVNRHKSNSFKALLNMFNLSENDDIQRDLLSLSIEKIFAYHKTGYFRKEQDVASMPTTLIKNFNQDS